MRILYVVGARPNFVKIAPIMQQAELYPQVFEQILVHTGQHYDKQMSKVFFDELNITPPDMNLNVGSGSHAQQTAELMRRFEPVLLDYNPDWVFVPGDVNSTVACALVASKLGVRVAHVESGLRSFDRTMPEEINRIITDHISDLLFTTEPSGNKNLNREGISADKVHYVGNTMIDSLVSLIPKARARWPQLQQKLELDKYVLVTLHRPSNVDSFETLKGIVEALVNINKHTKVVLPLHPRTRNRIASMDLESAFSELQLLPSLGYLDFLACHMNASLVITDSGGVQEESTYLGIRCMTVRPNTERPVTVEIGTNQLVESDPHSLTEAAMDILHGRDSEKSSIPALWDGKAAQRICEIMKHSLPAR